MRKGRIGSMGVPRLRKIRARELRGRTARWPVERSVNESACMSKPPPAPPSSDIEGVHRDRVPADDPAAAGDAVQRQRAEYAADSPGTPGPLDAGEGRGTQS